MAAKAWKRWLQDTGLCRNIERHNFLMYRLCRRRAESLPYEGRVVDLGCGSAPYRETILERADEYIGVDWQQSIHDHGRVDVFADLTGRLPFEDGFADTVVSFMVFEHLPEPEVFLQECRRILRPGGSLHLTCPLNWHVHEAPHDYFRYTHYGLEYLLKKHGFSDVEIEAETGFWQMWCLKFNYNTTGWAKGPMKYFWYGVWWISQTVAPWLDRLSPGMGSEHTTHYYARAVNAGLPRSQTPAEAA